MRVDPTISSAVAAAALYRWQIKAVDRRSALTARDLLSTSLTILDPGNSRIPTTIK